MSLIGALNVGQTALAAQQAALQVTGNNIANVGNANYTRQVATISSNGEQQIQPGMYVGTGVDVSDISRQIDQALQSRVNGSVSDMSAGSTSADWLGRVQTSFNALSGNDLGSQLDSFFKGWSDLANNPSDSGQRAVVLQNGLTTATTLQNLNTSLGGLSDDLNQGLSTAVTNANALAQQIADLNGQIAQAQAGTGGGANSLLDQRDAAVQQLSQYVDVKTVDQGNGVVNVLVGSEPLVDGTTNRGIALQQVPSSSTLQQEVVIAADHGTLAVSSGQIGAMVGLQTKIASVETNVNTIAHNLIGAVNSIHASGQGLEGFTSISAANRVSDATAALDDPAAGLAFTPTNGSFVVHVASTAQAGTGVQSSTLVKVAEGNGAGDTTLNSLAASLNGISGVTASVVAGQLKISATNPGTEITFSQDSSGVLSSLGINNFFTGKDATDIGVSQQLQDDPSLLAAAQNGQAGDNKTALAISQLSTQGLATLSGSSLSEAYQGMVNGVAVDVQSATNASAAATAVNQTLTAQKQSLSGVSLDEETVNMLQQQRAYQAASRLIAVVDSMLQDVIQLV